MKYLKWVLITVIFIGAISVLLGVKYSKDWDEDFTSFSSELLKTEISYVPQPVNYRINEEQWLMGKTENDTYMYYATQMFSDRSIHRIYSYDKNKKVTEFLTEISRGDDGNMLVGISSNGRKLLAIFNMKIQLVDLMTQTSKEIYRSDTARPMSVLGQDLYYQDKSGNIIKQNIKTGNKECMEGITAAKFVIYEGDLYYSDEDNNVFMYDLDTGETEKLEDVMEIGFFMEDGSMVIR